MTRVMNCECCGVRRVCSPIEGFREFEDEYEVGTELFWVWLCHSCAACLTVDELRAEGERRASLKAELERDSL
jgi:hypothetical protein